ncbi:auxin-responsive protein SAUR71-like [Phragmites australis]|uniref:auxin-responsive protein SAUR71-like n=1 Tax=Phragmites australis TaxID=29695 RepID=UPI002D78B72E|nr:auxin-responsive protein SAUR71-like [Phragmites australis]
MAVARKPRAPAAINATPHATTWRERLWLTKLSSRDRSGPSAPMRQMIRRLSRVGDCSSSSSSSSPARRRGGGGGGKKAHAGVPEGHVPVYVGGGGEGAEERFVVRTELLGAPALAELLGRAAQEYGYDHQGPLRIPCPVAVFRRALASVAADEEEEDGE